MKYFLIIAFATLFLAACGGDEQDTSGQKAAAPAPKGEMMEPSASAGGKKGEGMIVVDHAKDEIEFELKRALGGVERMIKQYKEEGFDTAELEAKKEKLEKELKDLVSG